MTTVKQPNDIPWDIIIIGAGPAGLAAAIAAADNGARVLILEREERPGGILKQCIHDGFGLLRFQSKLTGPEYAYRYLKMVDERKITLLTGTFTLELNKTKETFTLTLQNSTCGIFKLQTTAVVYAAGCRERTSRQVFLHGNRPAGVFTAGTAQYLINIQGYLPGKKCVILGSGDIGLIMARHLTLEGAEVEGVYEIKPEPSGLVRNIAQCLHDYSIPLHLSSTVTTIHGRKRVEGVTVSKVDENLHPLPGTERFISCDTLILSVGLIPENDLLESLGVELDPRTDGPYVDQEMMTPVAGLFTCGNALHVNDLVDYVSENGAVAGLAAATFSRNSQQNKANNIPPVSSTPSIPLVASQNLLYVVPQRINPQTLLNDTEITLYLRSTRTLRQAELVISADLRTDKKEIKRKKFSIIRPPEMEQIVLHPADIPPETTKLSLQLLKSGSVLHEN